jgi:hypothetical protein
MKKIIEKFLMKDMCLMKSGSTLVVFQEWKNMQHGHIPTLD